MFPHHVFPFLTLGAAVTVIAFVQPTACSVKVTKNTEIHGNPVYFTVGLNYTLRCMVNIWMLPKYTVYSIHKERKLKFVHLECQQIIGLT